MANPVKGITLQHVAQIWDKLSSVAPNDTDKVAACVFMAGQALFLKESGFTPLAMKTALAADERRETIMSDYADKKKIAGDVAFLEAAAVDTVQALQEFDYSTAFEQSGSEYRPSDQQWSFTGVHKLLPDIKATYPAYSFSGFSLKTRKHFTSLWDTTCTRILREFFVQLDAHNSCFAGNFQEFDRSGDNLFKLLRALVHALQRGIVRYHIAAFHDYDAFINSLKPDASNFMELHPRLKEQARAMPDINFKAMDYLVDQLHRKFDSFIPALAAMSKTDNSFATASNHIMEYLAGKPHSTKQAHAARTQPPPGCSLNAAGKVVCSYCKISSNGDHSWTTCRKRLADQQQGHGKQGQGSNKQQGAASNKQTQGGTAKSQQQALRSSASSQGRRAHFTAAEDADSEDQPPAEFPPPPTGYSYLLVPNHSYQAAAQGPPSAAYAALGSAPVAAAPGANPWLQQGQIRPNYSCAPKQMAYAHAASPGTRILDSGASVTTVGSNTHMEHVRPSNIRLHTTSGFTHNTLEGTCTLVFPDHHGRPVTLKLSALSSPDIEPGIVLISYHQLLKLGYRIFLTEDTGQIITPAQHVIILTVQDGVWHFPRYHSTRPCSLHEVPAEVANMVLGRGSWNNPPPALFRSAAPSSPAPSEKQPSVEQALPSPFEDDEVSLLGSSRSASPELFSSDLRDSSNESPDLQVDSERPATPLPAAAPANDVDATVTRPPHITTPSLPSPTPVATAAPSQSTPATPEVRTKRGRPATGWALTTEQAMRICQQHHEANHHVGGRKVLQRILYAAIPDKEYRPSTRHIQQFVCGPCAMAKSRAPAETKTHPSSPSPSGFLPGEFLYVDGSGAYNFNTVGHSTQHFIITCDASHAKLAIPTADKKPSTLISHLKTIQSHWGVKIKKIRTDQEFARSKEVRAWALDNDTAIEATPPYVHQANGKAERAHGILQDLARTQKLHAGANNLLWPESIRYAAKVCNLKQTTADSQLRSPLQICDNIPFQHSTLEHPPWGCAMFEHLGQRTDRSTAAAARARHGVFVGIEDNSRAYRMYDINSNKIITVGYANFDINKFPLKDIMLAGQPYLPTATVDPDSWLGAAHLSMDDATDHQLAEFACGSQLVIEVPKSFFPKHRGSWRMQCHRPDISDKVVSVVCLFDYFHGDKNRLPKDMQDYASKPKDSVFRVSPPVVGQDYSLRHALRLTYPNCKILSEMAAASTRSKGIYPSHPAVSVAQAAVSNISLFYQYEQAKLRPSSLGAFTARAADTMCLPPLQQAAKAPGVVPAKGAIGFTPKSRRQAQRHPSWPLWKQAEDAEINGLRQKGVFQRVRRDQLPAGTKVLQYQWVFADKESGPKMRYCARGDQEDPYPSPEETYSSTPAAPLVRAVFSHAAQHGRDLTKADITQAFTQADAFPPDVHIYIEPAEGHEEPGYVWRLLRPLYGLARAPAAWSATLRTFLLEDGWQPVDEGEDTMYTCTVPIQPVNEGDDIMILVFHVDDILLSSHPSCRAYATAFKARLLKRFNGRDEGPVSRYIGMDVHRIQDRIYLTQTPLVEELVDSMGLSDCNPVLTPMQPGTKLLASDRPAIPSIARTKHYQHIVGVLQFLTTWTRPDIGYATHELSKHQCNPGELHMDAAKTCVRYLAGTSNYGLVYRHVSENADRLYGFADSDWAGDTETRKSLSAHVFMQNGGPVLWHCKQQQGVATSTSEAEFVSASTAGKGAEWLRRILAGMGIKQRGPTPIYEDNKGCRLMSENPVQKSRTRHIDVSQHKVRDLVRNNVVRLLDCPTGDMVADTLTKALPAPDFRKHRDTILGYMPHTAPALPSTIAPWKAY